MKAYVILLACILITLGSDATSIVHNDTKPFDTEGWVKKPGNEWGSYYNIDMTKEAEAFNEIFLKATESDTACVDYDMKLLRYYKSYDNPSQRIYSYYCMKSREYEYILADIEKKEPISFHTELLDFGIYDAGYYPKDLKITDPTEVETTSQYLWDEVWNKVVLPEACENPTVEGVDHLEMKAENYLLYYRVPLMCNGGRQILKAEVFIDKIYEQYFDGKPTFCYLEDIFDNINFSEDSVTEAPVEI